MRTRRSLLLCFLISQVVFSLSLHAQQPTGSITGIVGDASGAVA